MTAVTVSVTVGGGCVRLQADADGVWVSIGEGCVQMTAEEARRVAGALVYAAGAYEQGGAG